MLMVITVESLMHGMQITYSSSLRNNPHHRNIEREWLVILTTNPRSQAGCTEVLVQKKHKCSAQHSPSKQLHRSQSRCSGRYVLYVGRTTRSTSPNSLSARKPQRRPYVTNAMQQRSTSLLGREYESIHIRIGAFAPVTTSAARTGKLAVR